MISLPAALVALATLGAGDTVLLDFYADWCGPCQQMGPVVDQLGGLGYPVRKVNVDRDKQLAAQYRVTGIPCFVLLVDGREVDRMEGAASIDSLKRMLAKGGVGPAGAIANAAPVAQQPPSVATLPPPPTANPAGLGHRRLDEFLPGGGASPVRPAAQPAPSLALPQQTAAAPLAAPLAAPAAPSAPTANAAALRVDPQQLVASSVRLKIEDATGNSFGSGTIVDVRGDQALVLTCGHIFRDSKGKGRITVDLFGPGAPQGLEGQVVGYFDGNDLPDVGLVSFRPGVPVRVAQVAPAGHRVQRGDPVVSVGCDNGADASARISHVASIDKYLGPPNVEVAGQPVQGRSGGGLFNADGLVIGVCNAADPSDDEGLFAAVASVHQLLDHEGLSAVYQNRGAAIARQSQPAIAPLGELVDIRSPQMPDRMPRAIPAGMPLTSSASPLGPHEQAALAQHQGAELVCVIRDPQDPHGRSQIVVLDRASPELLRQLALEQERQGARGATSLADSGLPQPPTATVAQRPVTPATPAVTRRPLNWLAPGTN